MEPQNITCQRCKTLGHNPQYFSCGHYLCSQCLSKILFISHLNDISSREQIQLKCICNAGTRDFSLASIHCMLESLTNSNTARLCFNHKTPAMFFCEECEQTFCDKCKEIHEEVNRDHKIMGEGDIERTICQKHKGECPEVFCTDCGESLCGICLSEGTSHEFHMLKSIEDYANLLRSQIHIQQSDMDIDILLSRIDKISVNFKDNLHTTLTKIEQLISILEESKAVYISKMDILIDRTDTFISIIKMLYSNFHSDLKKSLTTFDIKFLQEINEIQVDLTRLKLEYKAESGNLAEVLDENLVNWRKYIHMDMQPIRASWDSIHSWNNTLNITGHSNWVCSLTQLKDGRIASGSADHTIKIWKVNVKDFSHPLTLRAHKDTIWALLQLKDGRIASGSADKTIKLWEESEGSFKNMQTLTGHMNCIRSLIQLQDGRLLSGSDDKTIKLWEVNQIRVKPLVTVTGHSNAVCSLIQLEDSRIASGSWDNTIKLWEVKEREVSQTLTLIGHSNTVSSLFQLKDKRLASGSWDCTIKIWEEKEAKEFMNVLTISGHGNTIRSIIQLKDGSIASGSDDKTIHLWEAREKDFKSIVTLQGHSNYVYTVIQLNDGRIASGSADNLIKMWD